MAGHAPLVDALMVIVGGLLGAAVAVVKSTRALRATKLTGAQRAALQQLAARRGGGTLSARNVALELVVNGVFVRAEFRSSHSGDTTHMQARFALKEGPVFDVIPVGVGTFIARQLGAQDLALGMAQFDGAFIVKGWDHEGIKTAWSPRAQLLLCRELKNATVSSNGQRIDMSVPGGEQSPETLDAMADTMVALASGGAEPLTPFASLPGVSTVPAGGTWDTPERAKLTIETAVGDATAWLHWAQYGPRMTLKLSGCGPWPDERVPLYETASTSSLSALLPEDVSRLLTRVARAHLVGHGPHIRLEWQGVPTTDAFLAGLELLVGMATRARKSGVYR